MSIPELLQRITPATVRTALLPLVVALIVGVVCAPGLGAAPLDAHVTDATASLTVSQEAALEKRLADFEHRSGTRIIVLVVATTRPVPIDEFAARKLREQPAERGSASNGAMLVVAKDDHAVRIVAEGRLDRLLTKDLRLRILADTAVPRFERQDFAGGITETVQAMMDRASEPVAMAVADDELPEASGPAGSGYWLSALLAAGVAAAATASRRRSARSG